MLRRLLPPALVVLSFVSPVSGGEPTERLRTLFAEANRILLEPDGDTALEERVAAIRALVNEAFDAREAATLALAREWQARTPAERDEFVHLYADLVERAYLAWIGSRARVHGDGVRIAFESESVHGARATVVTTLQTRGGGEMPIEYRMHQRDGRWVVIDVVVDGLSLAASYRAQFHRVLQAGGYPELVERLHAKASPETRIAIMKAKRSRLAGATAPVRLASAAPASDAPPVLAPVVTPPVAVSPPPIAPVRPAAVVSPSPVPAPRPAEMVSAPPAAVVRPVPVVAPTPAAPAASAASVAPAVAPPARKGFWIQVGAFRNTDAAIRLVERLRKHSVTVVTGTQRAEPLARVLVGPFTNRAAAAAALRTLAAGGYRAFIAVE